MAPLPVAPNGSSSGAPRANWVGVAYGSGRPQGWTVLKELPGGALLSPPRGVSAAP
jgi:hypothetical protein